MFTWKATSFFAKRTKKASQTTVKKIVCKDGKKHTKKIQRASEKWEDDDAWERERERGKLLNISLCGNCACRRRMLSRGDHPRNFPPKQKEEEELFVKDSHRTARHWWCGRGISLMEVFFPHSEENVNKSGFPPRGEGPLSARYAAGTTQTQTTTTTTTVVWWFGKGWDKCFVTSGFLWLLLEKGAQANGKVRQLLEKIIGKKVVQRYFLQFSFVLVIKSKTLG